MGSISRRRGMIARGALLLTCLTLSSTSLPISLTRDAGAAEVIVTGTLGTGAAADAVEEAGGRVLRRLPIVDGVAASVPRTGLAALRARPGLSVSPNESIGFHAAPDPTPNSPWIQRIVRASDLWKKGVTGRGVTVALLDTGVYAGSPDLRGRVVHCEDFSGERNT